MRYIVLMFLISYSHLSTANCVFSGKVHPEEKRPEVEELYSHTCKWFADTFDVSYDPSIVLDSVSYEIPSDAESLKEKDRKEGIPLRFYGHFEDSLTKELDNITVKSYTENPFLEENEFLNKSTLVHELVHFFIKKSSFEIMKDAEFNVAMHEAIAFWSQNQYLQINAGHELMDYMENKKEKYELSKNFPAMAEAFLIAAGDLFLYEAVHFLDEDRITKFNKIVSGKYKKRSFSFEQARENR